MINSVPLGKKEMITMNAGPSDDAIREWADDHGLEVDETDMDVDGVDEDDYGDESGPNDDDPDF